MRELDVLLVAYLDRRYDQAPEKEKAAFRALLELPDPELLSYLLQNEQPAAEFADVIDAILDRTDP
jgi:succinate dehydrogenase flavin-adding protein (antitoxin of CptAB toxin-antitoxin module)